MARDAVAVPAGTVPLQDSTNLAVIGPPGRCKTRGALRQGKPMGEHVARGRDGGAARTEEQDILTDFRVALATMASEPEHHRPSGLPVQEAAILLTALPAGVDEGLDPLSMQDVDAFCERLSHCEISHPGEVFRERFFPGLGLSARACAQALGVTPAMLSLFMHGKRGISVVTAVKLAKLCGTSPAFWLRHQAMNELVATAHDLAGQVRRIAVPAR